MQSTHRYLGLACALVFTCLALPAQDPEIQETPETKKLLFLTHAGFYKHASLGSAEEAVMRKVKGRLSGDGAFHLHGKLQAKLLQDLNQAGELRISLV